MKQTPITELTPGNEVAEEVLRAEIVRLRAEIVRLQAENALLREDGTSITLRDQFAMAALSGMLASSMSVAGNPAMKFSQYAYEYADAMLEAREEAKE